MYYVTAIWKNGERSDPMVGAVSPVSNGAWKIEPGDGSFWLIPSDCIVEAKAMKMPEKEEHNKDFIGAVSNRDWNSESFNKEEDQF